MLRMPSADHGCRYEAIALGIGVTKTEPWQPAGAPAADNCGYGVEGIRMQVRRNQHAN